MILSTPLITGNFVVAEAELLQYLWTKCNMNRHKSGSSHQEVFLRNGVLKICSKFTREQPCWMGVLLYICCIFSQHLSSGTPLGGCFCKSNIFPHEWDMSTHQKSIKEDMSRLESIPAPWNYKIIHFEKKVSYVWTINNLYHVAKGPGKFRRVTHLHNFWPRHELNNLLHILFMFKEYNLIQKFLDDYFFVAVMLLILGFFSFT